MPFDELLGVLAHLLAQLPSIRSDSGKPALGISRPPAAAEIVSFCLHMVGSSSASFSRRRPNNSSRLRPLALDTLRPWPVFSVLIHSF